MVKGRCMKCKEQTDMEDARIIKSSRGGYMAKGICSACGCGMCRIMSKDNVQYAISNGEATTEY